jgi:maleate cis-trans isomerase
MTRMFGQNGRIGVIVPANNAVLEPELVACLPTGVTLHATRILVQGDLTPEAVIAMEGEVDRAVAELAATGVDVIVYADMVTTFIMEKGWNEARTADIAARSGIPCISAWTALRDALAALGVTRLALGTPYPAAIHALAPPFLDGRGFTLSGEATLDIIATADVPEVSPERLKALVMGLERADADAVVLLATDLPTLASISALEQATGLPVVSSNACILWSALRTIGQAAAPALGRLFSL